MWTRIVGGLGALSIAVSSCGGDDDEGSTQGKVYCEGEYLHFELPGRSEGYHVCWELCEQCNKPDRFQDVMCVDEAGYSHCACSATQTATYCRSGDDFTPRCDAKTCE